MSDFNYSIIVPYRDKYDLFLKAVESIPDREDIQVIVVDNAPESLSEKEIPVKCSARVDYVTSSKTKGAGCARNEGLRHVEGRFLLFLDADDYFTPDAFEAFDRYLNENYDIVFFNVASRRLSDGKESDRHLYYSRCIQEWVSTHDERRIRYRWPVPWAKMYRSSFILDEKIQFEEKPVLNDAWFSLMAGHAARRVFVDESIVYVVTEAALGQSLTKNVTRENSFLRFKTRVQINLFLKSIGRYDMHIRLLGSLRIAFRNFGVMEMLRYWGYAAKKRVSVF